MIAFLRFKLAADHAGIERGEVWINPELITAAWKEQGEVWQIHTAGDQRFRVLIPDTEEPFR